MLTALSFQQLFREILACQVEYSYGEREDSFTTMVPINHNQLQRIVALAKMIPFAGQWAWSVGRYARAIQPDEFLFRLDWVCDEPTSVTLYCRFPSEPGTSDFQNSLGFARGFSWSGPTPSALAAALGVRGPRGVAFRATKENDLRTAIYFRTEQHAGASWMCRLTELLGVCQYPRELAGSIEADLKELYRPGPVGVIGVDDGAGGVPTALKFDPSDVPLEVVFGFLARVGVSNERIDALKRIAIGLRAESATYVGVQYGPKGFGGFRLYFACEHKHTRKPAGVLIMGQRSLRPVRRLPHY
jgi:hypothetical protein